MSDAHLKLLEGFLQHKNAQDKWVQYWCVLKDYVIYIFKAKETSKENHIGVLQIGSDTQVKIGESDLKRGYRFDLFTAKKLNKFKTGKFIERELWKAYITGLTEGDISDNYDLMPDQIQKIRDDVHRVISRSNRPPLPINPLRSYHDPTGNVGTGFQSPTSSGDISFSSEPNMDNGGPITRHRFWPQRDKTDMPSWFFASITRDFAENILTQGSRYGNTLMRESITFRETGSYVISKKMEHTSRGPPFNHFEVIRISDGFKINVENAHQSMRCLSEVMDYFVNMSGSAVTRPVVTNDLKKLGVDAPGYDTKIWKSKTNAESGEEDGDLPQHTGRVADNSTWQNSSKTWGPRSSSRFNQDHPPQSGAFNHGRTMSSGPGQRPRVNSHSIQHRVDAANAVNHLDHTLDSYSEQGDDREYVNDVNDILEDLPPAPPPPACNLGSRRQSQPLITSPETNEVSAPPPHPRWQNRAMSVPVLPIPPEPLEQEVPLSAKSPGLVRPSQTPPRVLPKPPSEEEEADTPQMSALQLQLNTVKLRQTKEEKPWQHKRNTWHQSSRQMLPRSKSTSAAPQFNIYQPIYEPTNRRSYSCGDQDDDDDDYYDDTLAPTGVTFQDANSPTEPEKSTDLNESGGLKKEAFKKHLESLMKGVPAAPAKKSPLKSPVAPLPAPPKEEDYDDVIYEDPDHVL